MKKSSLLLSTSLLLFIAPAMLTACSDDSTTPAVDCTTTPDDPSCTPDFCDENPDAASCQPDFCDENPDAEECQPDVCDENPDAEECQPDVCDENPDAEECQLDVCDENPDAAECQTSACLDANGQLTDAAKDAIRAVLNLQSTAIAQADLPEVTVETVTEVDGENGPISAKNYRVLTFNLGGGQPDPNAPPTSKLYLDLENGTFLSLSDEDAMQSDDWDLALDQNNSSYVLMNSGYSGGYWGAWPAGLRIAAVEGVHSEADLLEVPGPDLASDMVLEQWYDTDTCAPILTNWPNEHGPSLHPTKDLPQTVVGGWYSYWFDAYDGDDFPEYQGQAHVTIPEPMAYAVYDSANRHKVYTFKFLDYNSRTGDVKIGIHDQFQQNACTKELQTVTEAVGMSDAVAQSIPDIDVYKVPGASRYEEDDQGNVTEIPLDYSLYTFTLPAPNAGDSKLYLDLGAAEFLAISDEEALTEDAERDGTVLREKNEDWDLAIDVANDNHIYVRSGQSGGYTHLDRFVSGPNPRGMMIAAVQNIAEEVDFMQLNGADQSSPDIQFAFEDFLDVDDATCSIEEEDGMPRTTIGNRLFDPNNNEAFVIYSGSPCHAVTQIKTLHFDPTSGEVQLGVIRTFAGICGP